MTTPTVTNGYTSLTEIKARKVINSTNDTDDAFIAKLIEAASRWIDSFTGRRFYASATDETRYFTAGDSDILYTDDIVSVTSLATDDGTHAWGTTWTANDYDLLPANAALDGQPYTMIQATGYNGLTFPTMARGVKAVGKFGYAASAPSDINIACQLIVVTMYQNRFGQNTTGAATITAAGVVITPSDIPASAVALLKPYRRLT